VSDATHHPLACAVLGALSGGVSMSVPGLVQALGGRPQTRKWHSYRDVVEDVVNSLLTTGTLQFNGDGTVSLITDTTDEKMDPIVDSTVGTTERTTEPRVRPGEPRCDPIAGHQVSTVLPSEQQYDDGEHDDPGRRDDDDEGDTEIGGARADLDGVIAGLAAEDRSQPQ
jgi:hypothetical protein